MCTVLLAVGLVYVLARRFSGSLVDTEALSRAMYTPGPLRSDPGTPSHAKAPAFASSHATAATHSTSATHAATATHSGATAHSHAWRACRRIAEVDVRRLRFGFGNSNAEVALHVRRAG